MLSVDAIQETVNPVVLILNALRLVGALGANVSGIFNVTTFKVELGLDALFPASLDLIVMAWEVLGVKPVNV